MAVAAPARKAAPPPPSHTSPPPARKARPTRHRPTPRGRTVAAPAPARKAPARRRRPVRSAPRRRRAGDSARLALTLGNAALAVRRLPDSGLVVRMTRGRAWIAVLGILLVGIVALNVITLSFAASAGKIDEQITTLEAETGMLQGRAARLSGVGPVRRAALSLGLAIPASSTIHFTDASRHDVATAAARLAAAGSG
jgi:hypothetical protein